MLRTQVDIRRLAEDAADAEEPEVALRTACELRAELDAFERERVAEALRRGASFGTIARALGISRQSAHRRYRDLAPAEPAAEPLTLSSHARRAILLGRQAAAAAGASSVGSAHVLLGVLRAGGPAARALEAEGITADRVRAWLHRGDARAPGYDEGTGRAVLAEAAAIARAGLASSVETEHLVLAALGGDDGTALRAIAALGATPAAVRDRLSA